MLNRRILRIKAFKTLYSFAENPAMTIKEAGKQQETSCEAARDLYLMMMALIPALTAEALQRTERAEDYLMSLGFRDFRVRLFGDGARIQLRENQFPLFMQHREAIVATLRQWYGAVLLDGEVRP